MKTEYEDRLQRLCAALPEGVCGIIGDDINRRYFTGMKSSAGVVAVFKDAAYLVIDFRYIEKAREAARGCEVIEQKKLYEQLGELIKKHGAKEIWTERDKVTLSAFDRMKKGLADCGAQVTNEGDLSNIIEKMRRIKSPAEIEAIIKAQRIAERAFENILDFIRPGVTEREIALELSFNMLKNGAEDISFETIALRGENTSMPHGVPSDSTVQTGDFVLMDFGAVYEGYHSDMTRTVAVGNVTDEMEEIYNIVFAAQEMALRAARAGITGKELDNVARGYISEKGYGENFGHGLGHCVGMEIHESPAANTRDETKLAENMVITVEPGIYLPKKFGVRIEDFVAITPDSCNNLTNAPKNLIKL
ncbi:MAG: aminopeptidase P family protein [Oscillospiraceae bacterium]|nr:aminopeptidase P family protein [Oscillospiraceae bacterium]